MRAYLRAALFGMAGLAVMIGLSASPAQEKPTSKDPAPPFPRHAVVVENDITFAKVGDQELQLDLARPKDLPGPFPALVFIHGGGWRAGSRHHLRPQIKDFATHGFVCATVSYRLAPQHPWPCQIEDCKTAVRFLKANAAKYHIDPKRFGAIGYSAGGHLSCLLGVMDKQDGLEGKEYLDQSSKVQAVVSFFGPTDFSLYAKDESAQKSFFIPLLGASFQEKPELYRQASPITYVRKNAASFLFFHGTRDPLVPIEHSHRMAAKLKEMDSKAEVYVLENYGHGWGGEKLQETLAKSLKFFKETLGQ